MTELDSSWQLGVDGLPFRQAARVVLLDGQERVLLLHGKDSDAPGYQWWFTIGGGLEPGETSRLAALRELAEETGIQLSESDLLGPIMRRQATFRFTNATVRQQEEFYLAKMPDTLSESESWSMDESGRTEIEQKTVDGYHWFSAAALEETAKTQLVFPTGLAQLLRQWLDIFCGLEKTSKTRQKPLIWPINPDEIPTLIE